MNSKLFSSKMPLTHQQQDIKQSLLLKKSVKKIERSMKDTENPKKDQQPIVLAIQKKSKSNEEANEKKRKFSIKIDEDFKCYQRMRLNDMDFFSSVMSQNLSPLSTPIKASSYAGAQHQLPQFYQQSQQAMSQIYTSTVANRATTHHGFPTTNQIQRSTVIMPPYRPFQSPPDFKLAKRHYFAQKTGKITRYAKQLALGNYCVCCNLPLSKKPFKLLEPSDNLACLGTAFPLFFRYIKQMIILLWIYFIIGGLQPFIRQIQDCQKANCDFPFGYLFRVTNVGCNSSIESQILQFLSFWVLIGIVIFMKLYQDKSSENLNKRVLSYSDFSLIMRNVPPMSSDDDFKTFLEQNLLPLEPEPTPSQQQQEQQQRSMENIQSQSRQGSQPKVTPIHSINRVYRIAEYYELIEKKIKLINHYEELKEKEIIARQTYEKNFKLKLTLSAEECLARAKAKAKSEFQKKKDNALEKLDEIKDAIEAREKHFTKIESTDLLTNIAIITFKDARDKQLVLERYANRRLSPKIAFQGSQIRFQPAYDPLDIIWENLEVPRSKKIFRQIFFIFCSLFLSFGSLCAIAGITLVQQNQEDKLKQQNEASSQSFTLWLLAFACMIVIVVINNVLVIVINLFAVLEMHKSHTRTKISACVKLSYITFINKALVLYVIILIFNEKNFNGADSSTIVSNLGFVFVGDMVFTPIIVIFSPMYFFKKLQRWWYTLDSNACLKTQQQMNEIFEDPQFVIHEYYASIHRIVLSNFFFAAMFGFGSFINVLSFFAMYYSYKYSLIRLTSYPQSISSELQEEIQRIMFSIPIVFTVGSILSSIYFMRCEENTVIGTFQIIMLCVSICLFVCTYFLFRIFQFHKFKITESLLIEPQSMGISYELANPITRAFHSKSRSRREQQAEEDQVQPNKNIFQKSVTLKQKEIPQKKPLIAEEFSNADANIPDPQLFKESIRNYAIENILLRSQKNNEIMRQNLNLQFVNKLQLSQEIIPQSEEEEEEKSNCDIENSQPYDFSHETETNRNEDETAENQEVPLQNPISQKTNQLDVNLEKQPSQKQQQLPRNQKRK